MKLCSTTGAWWTVEADGRRWSRGLWVGASNARPLSMVLPQLWALGHRCRRTRMYQRTCEAYYLTCGA